MNNSLEHVGKHLRVNYSKFMEIIYVPARPECMRLKYFYNENRGLGFPKNDGRRKKGGTRSLLRAGIGREMRRKWRLVGLVR